MARLEGTMPSRCPTPFPNPYLGPTCQGLKQTPVSRPGHPRSSPESHTVHGATSPPAQAPPVVFPRAPRVDTADRSPDPVLALWRGSPILCSLGSRPKLNLLPIESLVYWLFVVPLAESKLDEAGPRPAAPVRLYLSHREGKRAFPSFAGGPERT